MSILDYLKEGLYDQSNEIIIDIENKKGSVIGNVEGITHYQRDRLINWLDKEKVNIDVINFIKNIKDEDLLPISILKNINIFNDKYKGKGYGRKGLEDFLEKTDGSLNWILIADKDEIQKKGFDLVEWYQNYGFKIIGKSGGNPVMFKNFID